MMADVAYGPTVLAAATIAWRGEHALRPIPWPSWVALCPEAVFRLHQTPEDPDQPGQKLLTSASYRLLAIQSGSLQVILSGYNPLTLGSGAVLLLPAGSTGSLHARHRFRGTSVLFDVVYQPRDRRSWASSLPTTPFIQPSPRQLWGRDVPLEPPRHLHHASQQLIVSVHNQYWCGLAAHLRADAALATWLADVIGEGVQEGFLLQAKDPALQRALRLLHEKSYTDLQVHELAQAAGLSLASFRRRVWNEYGRSPADIMNTHRLHHAMALLRQPDQTISQVAVDCGYGTAATFIRAFRRATGLTPGAWRRNGAAIGDYR